MSLKIAFAGTPDFAAEILQALLKSTHNVVAVFTQPDRPAGRGRSVKMSPVKHLALRYQIPVYQPDSLKTAESQALLKSLDLDYLVVAAYGLILPGSILSLPKLGCLNVHASLLPRWRGASPIQQAILAGDALTGITIMQMDRGLDTGDILALYPCTIELHETAETLERRLADLGAEGLLETLKALELDQVVPQKQDDTQASYAGKIAKEEAKIDWADPAVQIDRKIRAFNPWPVAFAQIDQQLLRIFLAQPLDENLEHTHSPPGIILRSAPEGIEVATGKGILRIVEMQFAGGKRLPVAQILNAKAALFTPGKQFS